MSALVSVVGFAAASCTTVAFIPQVLKVWRSRSAGDISLGMYLLFSFGVFLWLCYGVLIVSWPVIIANAATLLLSCAVLVMKLSFDRAG